ncbi:hypothetical protein Ahy_A02g009874 [Arachis hypogaea]|uniref:Uncharacterized protein n=1 Tax=Arachis hypogaea TaxID=3818 RepID=A0A445EIH4_ARAHY|nr:hypothetical protein Ahy_A02g009874 [Arachis hypogaea]
MAAALVGGAFLSGFINVLFDRFLTTDAVNLVLGKKLGPGLVERLKTALLGAEALVADAEMKQFGNPSVRKWLDSLRDAVYYAEDLLDAVFTKAATQKELSSSWWSPSFFINRDRDDMVDKMEAVVTRIEDLGKQKDFLGLEKIPTGELIHLRYLDLSCTNIKTLPESLCKLCNLQTLKLNHCSKLTTLPSGLHNLVSLRHLDIRGTSLEEMPGKMSKLNQLHVLSFFIVGKHEENGIQELGGLVNLHGSFEIKKLENIVDVNEAKSAKMMDKKHIEELCLEWSPSNDLVSSTQKERDMLDNLQMHSGLKELKIKGYKGTIFPNWIGHCSYQNMTSVSLESCDNCCMLPSLGQLPSLKSLRIQRFHQLRSIGGEFYKNEGDHHSLHITPFPSLETLEFHYMACWEVWHVSESEAFPQLRMLEITNCPMLKEEMLTQVFFRIVSSLSDVSKVRKLCIYNSSIEWLPASMFLDGDTLSIRGCEYEKESALKAMISMNHLGCLQEIHISGYNSHVSFSANCFLKSLQKLKIRRCRKLEFPQQQKQNYGLVELQIEDSCDSLASLSLDAFPNLKNLEISWCRNLESVSMSKPPHAALQSLTIYKCHKLVSFAGEGLVAPNVTHLSLIECYNLKALPCDMNSLLPSLHSLQISQCGNLESISMSEAPHAALQRLIISGCSKLVSFAGEGLAAPNLTHLSITHCYKLEALPRDMNSLLPSLHSLEIFCCPNICRLPEAGLPPNLKSLEVGICEEQMRDLSWMANLEALTHLRIYGYGCKNIKSYPEVGLLPHIPSLTTLEIWCFDNLETLECNELLCLTSLQQLHISFCQKLENMEGEKLPPSLLLLQIKQCWRIWQGKSYLPLCYFFKFKTVVYSEKATRRRVAAKLSMKVACIFINPSSFEVISWIDVLATRSSILEAWSSI